MWMLDQGTAPAEREHLVSPATCSSRPRVVAVTASRTGGARVRNRKADDVSPPVARLGRELLALCVDMVQRSSGATSGGLGIGAAVPAFAFWALLQCVPSVHVEIGAPVDKLASGGRQRLLDVFCSA